MKTKTTKTTFTPEDWGNLYFPEGFTTIEDVVKELDELCGNEPQSTWTSHGFNCYEIAKEQLGLNHSSIFHS